MRGGLRFLSSAFAALLPALVFLSLLSGAQAFDSRVDLNAALMKLEPGARQDLAKDVAGSTLFVIALQSSRMLIYQLRLPVRGELEFAADAIAALYLLGVGKDDLTDQQMRAIKAAFRLLDTPRSQRPGYFRTQTISISRVRKMLCLMIGSNPNRFAGLQEEFGFNSESVTRCMEEYEKTKDVWSRILERSLRQEGDDVRRVAVSYNKVPRGGEVLVDLIRQTRVLESAATGLDDFFRLPAPVILRAASCGEETARFDPRSRDFLICYDLLARFAEDLLEQSDR